MCKYTSGRVHASEGLRNPGWSGGVTVFNTFYVRTTFVATSHRPTVGMMS